MKKKLLQGSIIPLILIIILAIGGCCLRKWLRQCLSQCRPRWSNQLPLLRNQPPPLSRR